MPPRLFLKLLTAHLLGDYLLQPSQLALEQHRSDVLVLHGLAHAVLLVLVGLTEPATLSLWLALLFVLAAHSGIDAWTSRREPRDFRLLVLDQSLHLASLLAVPAGATVVGRWVQPFREALSDASREQRAGLERAGRWIGMLERLLVFA